MHRAVLVSLTLGQALMAGCGGKVATFRNDLDLQGGSHGGGAAEDRADGASGLDGVAGPDATAAVPDARAPDGDDGAPSLDVLFDSIPDGPWYPCGPPVPGLFSCCQGLPCRGTCNSESGDCQCNIIKGGCKSNAVCCPLTSSCTTKENCPGLQ
jgi:hypothetical protein